MKQFYTYYQRTNHKNIPVDQTYDLNRSYFNQDFQERMIEVSKVERVVSTYILDDNIHYEAV
ncbi:MAG: hypothetical protein ACI9N9_001204 [Enterobacterales bacterium]|jgi:hypothetical protein